MDSMLGYQNERYLDFGYAAARLDDVFNFWPARLGSLLMIWSSWLLASARANASVFRRDRLSRFAQFSPSRIGRSGSAWHQLGGTVPMAVAWSKSRPSVRPPGPSSAR